MAKRTGYHIKHGNRYSQGNTLTDREAKTVWGCLNKIVKIANKKGTYIGQKDKLYDMAQLMIDTIEDAGRGYLLSENDEPQQPEIYGECNRCYSKKQYRTRCERCAAR